MIHIQMTQGRSLEVTVYWGSVQGAESYIAFTTNGQNCTSTVQSFCFLTPVDCGQNHSVSVIAYNKAGPSDPSQPADYITCGYITHIPYKFKSLHSGKYAYSYCVNLKLQPADM